MVVAGGIGRLLGLRGTRSSSWMRAGRFVVGLFCHLVIITTRLTNLYVAYMARLFGVTVCFSVMGTFS